MNAKELAEALNGRPYPFYIERAQAAEIAAAGLVVVYGASDDLMEFQGAFRDEVGCNDGGDALIDAKGVLCRDDGDEDDEILEEHFKRLKSALTITANWDTDGYSWTYTTDIPHETFEIFDDGEKYCRAIVFSIEDVKKASLERLRVPFEKFIASEPFYACGAGEDDHLERDPYDGGYVDSGVHGAWKAWIAATIA